MKIKKFFEATIIYDIDFKSILPPELSIIQDKTQSNFKLGNIMKHADMIQIMYEQNRWGLSDTLEFDIYFEMVEGQRMKILVDISFGDMMVSEFSILSPSKVEIIEYTSYGSKMDPSNTLFCFTDDSLENIVNFINKINGFEITTKDLRFLSKNN